MSGNLLCNPLKENIIYGYPEEWTPLFEIFNENLKKTQKQTVKLQ